MQKAEPQRRNVPSQLATKKTGGIVAKPIQTEATAQFAAMMKSSPQLARLDGLAAMMNAVPATNSNSEPAAQLRTMNLIANNKPLALQRMVDSTHSSPNRGAAGKFSDGANNSQEKVTPLVGNAGTRQPVSTSASPAQLEQQSAVQSDNTGLPHNLKRGIENLSGMSMDNVKVHYNSSWPAQLNALAYAQGADIHIAPGQEHYLPHESWHVVQQAQGRVPTTMQMTDGTPVNDDRGLEQEADVMGERAVFAGHGMVQRVEKGNAREMRFPDAGHASVQCMSVMQLMRSNDQRDALIAPFLQNAAHLKVGYLTAEANLRNAERRTAGNPIAARCMIVFDGAIRDNFSIGLTSVEKDHVYAMVVSNAGGVPIVGQGNWRRGWIAYQKIDTDDTRSTALAAAVAVAPDVLQGVNNYLAGLGGGGAPRSVRTRAEHAPASIKAWAERTGTDLAMAMPLAGQQALHGIDFHAALANDANLNAYTIIDPNNELNLNRLDPNHATFADFSAFLNANAAAMPGTMAKDHELRDEGIGGERAAAGRAWLQQAGINDTKPGLFKADQRPDIVAVTGANVTNIFINSHAPTWAAYNANVAALQAEVAPVVAPQIQAHPGQQQPVIGPVQVIPAPAPAFEPWQVLQGVGAPNLAAFVAAFTHPRPGEEYLFHGTSRANVFNISKTGFNPEYVNYTFPKGYGKTGYGTAFTDQFAKALAYAPPEAVPQGAGAAPIYKHYVIVARVFIGNVYDVGDEARRTRGNLELTESNINYEESRGNKMRAQGEGKSFLGRASSTVRERLDAGEHLHSTYQHRNFDLNLDAAVGQAQPLQYRDTSITVSDAIQMYPMFIIEATIPQANVSTGRR